MGPRNKEQREMVHNQLMEKLFRKNHPYASLEKEGIILK